MRMYVILDQIAYMLLSYARLTVTVQVLVNELVKGTWPPITP